AQARIRVHAYPNLERTGAVTALAPVADADTGNFVVEIITDNDPADRPLLPGMTARVELVAGALEQAFRLPGSAILGGVTARSVYVVVSEDGIEVARRRPIRIARTVGASALLGPDSGLRAGDRVVLRGQRGLRDGSRVEASAPPQSESTPPPQGGPPS
ncbi:hypothetical protein HQ560_20765, partial [bacterium]|nr:hypothetical protein [bacterium]